MATNIDLNDPDVQRYIKMALASQAVAPPQKPRRNILLELLWGLLLATMIGAFVVLAAPKAIELWMWYQEGMPVADAPATPTADPLPTAYVVQPQPQPQQPVVIVQPQAPAPPQPAPVEPTPAPPPPEPYRVDAGINQGGPYISVAVPQAPQPAPAAEPQAPPTPAPGEPGFRESFERPDPAKTCMFIGCLHAPAPTPWPTTTGPQPGEPGFRESFEAPGADQ